MGVTCNTPRVTRAESGPMRGKYLLNQEGNKSSSERMIIPVAMINTK